MKIKCIPQFRKKNVVLTGYSHNFGQNVFFFSLLMFTLFSATFLKVNQTFSASRREISQIQSSNSLLRSSFYFHWEYWKKF